VQQKQQADELAATQAKAPIQNGRDNTAAPQALASNSGISTSQNKAEVQATTAYADCEGQMNDVEVHAGPQSSTRLLETLGCGEQLTVLGKADEPDWFNVRTQEGVEGYVWMFLSDHQPSISAKTVSAQDKALNGDPEHPLHDEIMVSAKVPACPSGSQPQPTWTDTEGQTRYSCKVRQRQSNTDMCLEWEGDHWNSDNGVVPCSWSVSSTTDRQYTRVLKMLSDQNVPSCSPDTQRFLMVKSGGQIQRTCETTAATKTKEQEFLKKGLPADQGPCWRDPHQLPNGSLEDETEICHMGVLDRVSDHFQGPVLGQRMLQKMRSYNDYGGDKVRLRFVRGSAYL
jgi:hypothetical protein